MHAPRGLGSEWLGAALVAAGMVTSSSATVRYRQLRMAIERGSVGAPSATMVYVVGIAVAMIGLGMTVLLVKALGS